MRSRQHRSGSLLGTAVANAANTTKHSGFSRASTMSFHPLDCEPRNAGSKSSSAMRVAEKQSWQLTAKRQYSVYMASNIKDSIYFVLFRLGSESKFSRNLL